MRFAELSELSGGLQTILALALAKYDKYGSQSTANAAGGAVLYENSIYVLLTAFAVCARGRRDGDLQ